MDIVIKVGTQSILSEKGVPYKSVMLHLVEQIVQLQQNGHHVVLVSSGAVASGRHVTGKRFKRNYGKTIGEKQFLASIGQHELMQIYANLFKKSNILASQILLTKQDFHTRKHYLNIARLLREILNHKEIVPIINENDSVAIEELMFTDNDELAGLIAAQMNAHKLIILSNVQGVFTGDPKEPDSKLISIIDQDKGWPKVSSTKSSQGRGGMQSKLVTAKKMAKLGITTHIAHINQPSIITRLVAGESIGTTILPSKKKSNIKRWIAFNENNNIGSIKINNCLYQLLLKNQDALSILPIGIMECSQVFKKGDIVEILNSEGEKIGIGMARYESTKLQEFLGKKDKPAFIHYDHLHIF